MLNAALIIAFIVYFLRATTWKGMIFFPLAERAKNFPDYIKKPLYECPICMTPWWGVAIYLAGHYTELAEFNELSVQRLVFTVFTASGINTLFVLIHKIQTHLKKSIPNQRSGNQHPEEFKEW